ncbi:MAG: cupin domain-containing protein [Myxococcota bacterium]
MAHLQFNGGETSDLDIIAEKLAPLGVQLKGWPTNPEVAALLAQAALSDDQKEIVLRGHDRYFAELQQSDGYQTRDLIVLHPGIPGLDQLLQKFDRPHTHDDDEVRYIIDGEGVFGFIYPDGSQARLTMHPGEYINVPKNTEHWFEVTDARRIKAVRYFTNTDGWTPRYTETQIRA